MKVAVSTDNGNVSPHFGRCPEFTLVEIDEKFSARGISDEHKDNLLVELRDLSTYVEVRPSDVKRIIIADPDDDFVLACAIVGQADYLVTYDAHFDVLEGEYQGIKIVEALPFL